LDAPQRGIGSGGTRSTLAEKQVPSANSPSASKPSPEAVLKRQTEIYKKIRDNDLTGENITVQIKGKILDAAALDRELVLASGKSTGLTARDVIKLAGNLKGATINIEIDGFSIFISQKHLQLEGENNFSIYPTLKSVYFHSLRVNQTSSKLGLGTALRLQQLVAAEKLGMIGASLDAAREESYPSGYFTWPKFGFDAELPNGLEPKLRKYLQANPDIAKKLAHNPDALPTHLMLSELLFNADGSDNQDMQAWWKTNGVAIEMEIDFSGPSGARFHKTAKDLGWLGEP
jgi:hypothetical protein